MKSIAYPPGATASAPPARVTPIEEGRVTYRAAAGKQKETYLGIPSSLLPRLYASSLAEFRLQLYVWQRTGGWKDYHAHPQPMRITFAEWTSGRPGYAQDGGAHLCTQGLTTTRDALIARGWLYEEWETPHVRGPRRYALIAPDNPGIGPYQREDGAWEVLLLTEEGPQPYQIPEAVLQHRTAEAALLQHRTAPLLQRRKGCSTTSKSALLQPRKEKSRHAFPGAGPAHPIANVLANCSSTQQEQAKGAANAASAPEETPKRRAVSEQESLAPLHQEGNDTLTSTVEGALPPTAELASNLPLFLTAAMPPSEAPARPAAPSKQARRKGAKERTPRPPNLLYTAWKQHAPDPPASQAEISSICVGLARLSDPEETERQPVTLEELPELMYQVMSWKDKDTGTGYTPTPHLILKYLSRLRGQLARTPAPRVLLWRDLQRQTAAVEAATAEGQAEEREPSAVAAVAPEETVDPTWLASLRTRVEAEGISVSVSGLWETVRTAAQRHLSPGQYHWLEHVTPVWDAATPERLLLLTCSRAQANGITRRFAGELLPYVQRSCPCLTALEARYVPAAQMLAASLIQPPAAAGVPQPAPAKGEVYGQAGSAEERHGVYARFLLPKR